MIVLAANLFKRLEQVVDPEMEVIAVVATGILYHITGMNNRQIIAHKKLVAEKKRDDRFFCIRYTGRTELNSMKTDG